jgi:pyrimidine oxygenase
VGSYETLARRLATSVIECDLDGLMITVPDYVVDLEAVAKKTMPLMAEYGVTCHVGAPSSS